MERHRLLSFSSRRASARTLFDGLRFLVANPTCRATTATVGLTFLVAADHIYAQPNPWPANPNWQQYVLGPKNQDVSPVKVVSVSGNVTNPQALLDPNSSPGTTLTTSAGATPASILLDYGQDTNGVPWFNLTSAHGSPTLVAAYSEGLQYIQANPTPGRPVAAVFWGRGSVEVGFLHRRQCWDHCESVYPGRRTFPNRHVNHSRNGHVTGDWNPVRRVQSNPRRLCWIFCVQL
jgi:hypothetical protein